MTKKTTVANEVASALGAVAARVENLKPKRTTAKHTKAKSAAQPIAAQAVPAMLDKEEVALEAYLYSEARGFRGGSQEEDWFRAEVEVRSRRG